MKIYDEKGLKEKLGSSCDCDMSNIVVCWFDTGI
jgi:hypothetical protein